MSNYSESDNRFIQELLKASNISADKVRGEFENGLYKNSTEAVQSLKQEYKSIANRLRYIIDPNDTQFPSF